MAIPAGETCKSSLVFALGTTFLPKKGPLVDDIFPIIKPSPDFYFVVSTRWIVSVSGL